MERETSRDDVELRKKIGLRVRHLRRDKRLTQEDFADKAGLHKNYIGQVERGERMVTVGSLRRIVTPLGVTVSEFLAQIGE